MPRYRSIDEILSEEDELGLLNVKLRPRAARTPEGERDAQLVRDVNAFFDRAGHVPDPEAADYEEMRLGMLWAGLVGRGPVGDLTDDDRNGLLSGAALTLTAEPAAPERDWREELNRPGFTGGQNSRRIAHYGTDTKEEDLEAVFT